VETAICSPLGAPPDDDDDDDVQCESKKHATLLVLGITLANVDRF